MSTFHTITLPEMFADPGSLCWLDSRGGAAVTHAMAKQLHFNKNMEALKKLQAGVDKLSSVVGVTLGPKVQHQGQIGALLHMHIGNMVIQLPQTILQQLLAHILISA